MRKLYFMTILTAAVCAFSAAMASSAFAEEVWTYLMGGSPISGPIKLVILPENEPLLFEDMKAPGTPDVLCVPEGEGLALLNGEGELTVATCGNATEPPADDKGTCAAGSIKVIAADLPWLTPVVEKAGSPEGLILADGKGEPGWEVECTILGIKVKDKCTTENRKIIIENTEDGLIMASSSEEVTITEQANCSLGGKEVGLVAGLTWYHYVNSTDELITMTLSLAPRQ